MDSGASYVQHASGWHQTADNKKTVYADNFAYGLIGNITSKVQTHLIVHGLDPVTSSSTNPRDKEMRRVRSKTNDK
jgi:hypothetical protein